MTVVIVISSPGPLVVFVMFIVEFTPSISIPPALPHNLIASASVLSDVKRISVAAPTVVISRSSEAAFPVTLISIPPAVVVIVRASSSVPAELKTKPASTLPNCSIVKCSPVASAT